MDAAYDRPRYIAFDGDRCVASGDLHEVARSAKKVADEQTTASILIFDGLTSQPVEIDFRGDVSDVLARLPLAPPEVPISPAATLPARSAGRPKLGVIAREITLLPRHWDWLATQRGGASVTIRTLIDDARKSRESQDSTRQAQESAFRFMSAMAGNYPLYEDATRALFANDAHRFSEISGAWPHDVRQHARRLANAAFHSVPASIPTDG